MDSVQCRSLITPALFEEAASQEGQLPTGQAVWKEVRARMAAANGARKALADECPASCIGALLTMLVQQVRLHCMLGQTLACCAYCSNARQSLSALHPLLTTTCHGNHTSCHTISSAGLVLVELVPLHSDCVV